MSPQKALEYGFIDEIGLENLDTPEKPDDSTLQQVLKENEALKKQLCNKSEHERQLAEFYQLTHKEADKPKSNDWGSFFN